MLMPSAFKDTPTATPHLYRILMIFFLAVLFVACDNKDDKPVTYRVTFDTNGGEPATIDPKTVKSGEKVQEPDQKPTKGDSVATGWINTATDQPYDFSTAVTTDLTLKAVYAKAYKVTFDTEGGGELTAQTVEQGKTATRPPTDPIKTGHTFDDWYTDKTFTTVFNFDTTRIASDTKVFAKFTIITYTVSFNADGAVTEQTVDYNGTATRPPADPKKTGYIFEDWYTDDTFATVFDFDHTAITADTEVFAKFTLITYTVSFKTEDGNTVAEQTVAQGKTATKPNAPVEPGHYFMGDWYTDAVSATSGTLDAAASQKAVANRFDFTKPITGSITLYAFFKTIEKPQGSADGAKIDDLRNLIAKGQEDARIGNTGNFNWIDVSDMTTMYYFNSSQNKQITPFIDNNTFNGDISEWDVSNVTDMYSMFYEAASFNQPLSSWNVGNVTDMAFMFYKATQFNQPLNSWNISSVTSMANMFFGATSFNQTLNKWNVSNVEDIESMFREATSFNGDISDWDVSKVTDMTYIFREATSFNGDINDWDVSEVTDMTSIFYQAASFNQSLSNWKVGNVTNMRIMFFGAASFNQPLSSWDVSSVVYMGAMFSGATKFNQDLSGWDVSKVTSAIDFDSGATAWEDAKKPKFK